MLRRKQKKPNFTVRKWDPLYVIFEKHLYDFNYESRDNFIDGVVQEYMVYLHKTKIYVPPVWQEHMKNNLREEVANMLVRRIYGCLTIEEHKGKQSKAHFAKLELKEIRKRYERLTSC